MSREQMRAMLEYLEIERQTQEKLAQVRQELAKLVYISRVDLDINLS